jgi:hypothetical protein
MIKKIKKTINKKDIKYNNINYNIILNGYIILDIKVLRRNLLCIMLRNILIVIKFSNNNKKKI